MSAKGGPEGPLVWDVALRRGFSQGASRFMLDVRFASRASRIVLHGPSGSGKSQTLRLIAGLARAEAGHVRIAGRCLADAAQDLHRSPQDRRLGTVFQDYALFPHLSVRQNIAFGLQPGRWLNPAGRTPDPRVDRWMTAFRLHEVADHLPHQISGGQRQRTALARALVTEPQALLLDEPFAALDQGLRRRLRGELAALQEDLRLPMLLITHDEDDVQALADDVVHLEDGKVVAQPAADAWPDPDRLDLRAELSR